MRLMQLQPITEPRPISQLTEEQLRELPIALSRLSYAIGEIDGLIEPRNSPTWAEFKTDVFQGNPNLIRPGSIEILQKKLNQTEERITHNFELSRF